MVIKPNDDATVTVEISGTYTRAELMAMLETLGAEAAKLAPAMPEAPAAPIPSPGYSHWGYLLDAEGQDGDFLLSLYHPGFGWITNRMPASAAGDLASRLSIHVTNRLAAIERGMQLIRERGVAAVAAGLVAATAPAENGASVH